MATIQAECVSSNNVIVVVVGEIQGTEDSRGQVLLSARELWILSRAFI
jgi:hypothetical protein